MVLLSRCPSAAGVKNHRVEASRRFTCASSRRPFIVSVLQTKPIVGMWLGPPERDGRQSTRGKRVPAALHAGSVVQDLQFVVQVQPPVLV